MGICLGKNEKQILKNEVEDSKLKKNCSILIKIISDIQGPPKKTTVAIILFFPKILNEPC